MEQPIELLPFDVVPAMVQLLVSSAVSLPIVPLELCRSLAEEAHRCRFTPAERYAGPNRVEQNLEAATELPEGGRLRRFSNALQTHLCDGFRAWPFSAFDGEPLAFNQLVLQRYEPCAIGVGPHRDFSSDRNLIAVLTLEGKGEFCLCDNRAGENPRPLNSSPGDLVLLTAPGFHGFRRRPWHLVRNITTPRLIVALRQVT